MADTSDNHKDKKVKMDELQEKEKMLKEFWKESGYKHWSSLDEYKLIADIGNPESNKYWDRMGDKPYVLTTKQGSMARGGFDPEYKKMLNEAMEQWRKQIVCHGIPYHPDENDLSGTVKGFNPENMWKLSIYPPGYQPCDTYGTRTGSAFKEDEFDIDMYLNSDYESAVPFIFFFKSYSDVMPSGDIHIHLLERHISFTIEKVTSVRVKYEIDTTILHFKIK